MSIIYLEVLIVAHTMLLTYHITTLPINHPTYMLPHSNLLALMCLSGLQVPSTKYSLEWCPYNENLKQPMSISFCVYMCWSEFALLLGVVSVH